MPACDDIGLQRDFWVISAIQEYPPKRPIAADNRIPMKCDSSSIDADKTIYPIVVNDILPNDVISEITFAIVVSICVSILVILTPHRTSFACGVICYLVRN